MADKRQQARVQGAWAAPKRRPAAQPAAAAGSHLQQTPGQTWRDKEHRLSDREFVFREPQQVVRRAPEPRVIEEGVYELSLSPSGVSSQCFFLHPGYVYILALLTRRKRTGCWTSCVGMFPGNRGRASERWPPVLRALKHRIEENTGHTFNSLLCNLYRSEKDSVDWHSDDEPTLGRWPVIASLSFGAMRTFEMRKKPPPEENGDYTYVERVKIPLDHGALLIMEGATQADWQHRVPKEYHSREPRVNLTFRTVYPDPGGAPR
ncbi:alpha-ketoglutarate-dependent dioxygenase alkB homolog 3 isoform X4 [Fukomys damarensis]|uniref:alpha-ketoglutarate-dependent dioxygenase alkB homolog 3 isoform X4 n=1 Tax=Fukomys damarensis TaxID=885580 RepID=UPI00053F9863|nr:alpha-ketoglutarate-dependent dioxygenase alkB homolog 3 isoform X4 [Fukomys damarensis]